MHPYTQYKNNPKLNELSERARVALAELDAIVEEAEILFPIPENYSWQIFGNGRLFPRFMSTADDDY